MICTAAAGAVNASFRVSPGGMAYTASVEVEGAAGYGFWDTGPLGERIPRPVSNVSLRGACGNCSFNWVDPFTMNFTEGNYTILYSGQIMENHLQGTFESPYHVSVLLPQGLDVRDPFLGMRSPGSEITGNSSFIAIDWNSTRSFEIRFYTPERERLLWIFGVLWLVGLVLVLIPYLMSRRGKEGGKP
ncbi:MAG: hypothetical protein LUO97_06060 [Methanomicrobiales archaeon]|nr:hypothetical protein [Methanomicrobiales archaeon]MDD1669348.1 hypothetical protein [Methanomicrobiales archaeon]